jgi:hypothetical protein
VAQDLCLTFLATLEVFRPALTRPGFANMLAVAVGWILVPGAVTYGLVATSLSAVTHHEKFHRFLSRGSWDPDELGCKVFGLILRYLPAACVIPLVIDDTVTPKKGPQIFGISNHLDPVRSTRRYRVFCFGHCWVVLAVLVKLPFAERAWALPLLFRLYVNKKTCAAKKLRYRKKTQLAREMMDVVVRWAGSRRIELVCDSAYCNKTVIGGVPASVTLVGDMRPDAVLTTLPPERKKGEPGRQRKRGDRLPKPVEVAQNNRVPWKRLRVNLYGYERQVEYKHVRAQWYRACETRLLHIVIVKVTTGTIGIRVFFSTDPEMSVQDILARYSWRWAIESTFRDLKQLFGFADSSAHKQTAVERTAPFFGLIFSLLVIWYAEHVFRAGVAVLPVRPWYSHKRGHSFADVLRAARRVFIAGDICDLLNAISNLRNPDALPPKVRHRLPQLLE